RWEPAVCARCAVCCDQCTVERQVARGAAVVVLNADPKISIPFAGEVTRTSAGPAQNVQSDVPVRHRAYAGERKTRLGVESQAFCTLSDQGIRYVDVAVGHVGVDPELRQARKHATA